MTATVQLDSQHVGWPGRDSRPVAAAVSSIAIIGLGAVVYMGVTVESAGALRARGGPLTFAGQLAGLSGTYLMLLMLLLVARLPVIERSLGHDRLVRWHRLLGQWPIYLITLHIVLITAGYAEADRTGVVHQFSQLVESYPDVLAALVAFGLIVVAAVLSIRQVRRAMRYETWWSIHLYMYLALVLAYSHQIANGQSFVGHPLDRWFWAALWIGTGATVLAWRVVVPVVRSLRHDLRVVGVTEEAHGICSIVCRGRDLAGLQVQGGQFFQWRFLTRGHWWSAHPYSVSALPRADMIRITVKDLGDHSSELRHIPLGTRVVIEGPYGTFTRRSVLRKKVLLVGAGVGVTPVRSLLEHLPLGADVTLILRATRDEEILFRPEFESLMARRPGQIIVLTGSRGKHPLDQRELSKLVPDIVEREVYVCGPEALSVGVAAAARVLGVPERHVHLEQFAF